MQIFHNKSKEIKQFKVQEKFHTEEKSSQTDPEVINEKQDLLGSRETPPHGENSQNSKKTRKRTK